MTDVEQIYIGVSPLLLPEVFPSYYMAAAFARLRKVAISLPEREPVVKFNLYQKLNGRSSAMRR